MRKLERKILNGFVRISEVLKSLLWEKAKEHGISPIQIQILLFVSEHKLEINNVSYLAKEFLVTKATVSDAVKVLINKGFLQKDFSPADKRRYNLLLTQDGKQLVDELSNYADPVLKELTAVDDKGMENLFKTMTDLIYRLNKSEIIQVQRTCFRCKYYDGNFKAKHYCKLIESQLAQSEIRLDCPEFEVVS